MAMSNEKREEILLSSFEVLKDEFEDNSEEIQNIMQQIMDFNPKLVLKMWHYLIENNGNLIANDKSGYGAAYDLLAGMVYQFTEKSSFTSLEESMVEDKVIVNAVYEKTPTINGAMLQIIGNMIQKGKISDANRMLELLYNNKRALEDKSFTEVLQDLIEAYLLYDREYGSCLVTSHKSREYNSNVQDLIQYWINKVEDRKEKAKLNISFVKIC